MTANMQPEVQVSAVVKVARDLTEIVELAARLASEAENKANDSLMPGGLAMVALGGVANLEAWENRYAAAETFGRPTEHVADEDDTWEPPLQTLCFWSEQWRAEHGAEYDKRPTLATEANYIRWALDWAWDNETHWADFATDIRKARTRMENLLVAGVRAERGVPCMYDECRGIRLVRSLKPARDDEGRKIWAHTPWHCPRCHREWDEARYAAMVTAANEASKVEIIDGEEWVAPDLAARRVDRPASTIRQWIHKGHLEQVCLVRGQRIGFVRMADVWTRHQTAKRRGGSAA